MKVDKPQQQGYKKYNHTKHTKWQHKSVYRKEKQLIKHDITRIMCLRHNDNENSINAATTLSLMNLSEYVGYTIRPIFSLNAHKLRAV